MEELAAQFDRQRGGGADVDETKMPGRSAERPIGNKKAKAGKKPRSAEGWKEAMAVYVKEVTASSANKLKMHADIQSRWNIFLALAEDKAKAAQKAKERSIMETNMADMSPDQKAYFQAERRRIMAERAARVAAEASALAKAEEEEEVGEKEEEAEKGTDE